MKLGIAGTGVIVKEVLPILKKWNWEITALCGTKRSEVVVKELCQTYSISNGYTDYQEMLESKAFDTLYIGVPNFLHYEFVKQALEANLNVIVEKPITSTTKETEELIQLAKSKHLYLFEAITTIYLENYKKIQEWIPQIGTIKLVSCIFNQYSRRYDALQKGEVLPVFNRAKSGGVLMDINVYNIHYLLGLFGKPNAFAYYPNIENEVDTSGLLTMQYDTFKVSSMGAKDCGGPCQCIIYGTKGYIAQYTPANVCGAVTLHLNDGTEETFNREPDSRFEGEFKFFKETIESGDYMTCYKQLAHSLEVINLLTKARLKAGIVFPADEN